MTGFIEQVAGIGHNQPDEAISGTLRRLLLRVLQNLLGLRLRFQVQEPSETLKVIVGVARSNAAAGTPGAQTASLKIGPVQSLDQPGV